MRGEGFLGICMLTLSLLVPLPFLVMTLAVVSAVTGGANITGGIVT